MDNHTACPNHQRWPLEIEKICAVVQRFDHHFDLVELYERNQQYYTMINYWVLVCQPVVRLQTWPSTAHVINHCDVDISQRGHSMYPYMLPETLFAPFELFSKCLPMPERQLLQHMAVASSIIKIIIQHYVLMWKLYDFLFLLHFYSDRKNKRSLLVAVALEKWYLFKKKIENMLRYDLFKVKCESVFT